MATIQMIISLTRYYEIMYLAQYGIIASNFLSERLL